DDHHDDLLDPEGADHDLKKERVVSRKVYGHHGVVHPASLLHRRRRRQSCGVADRAARVRRGDPGYVDPPRRSLPRETAMMFRTQTPTWA
ncbi:MAG: hypothetical protein ACAH88_15255, partial [Roseimicrobium sp.]